MHNIFEGLSLIKTSHVTIPFFPRKDTIFAIFTLWLPTALTICNPQGIYAEEAGKKIMTAAPSPFSTTRKNTTQPPIPTIIALGDSLTAGHGVPSDKSYPALIQNRLKKEGYRYNIINAGISGDTTYGGLNRLPYILKKNPVIVILELGVNDGLRGTNLALVKMNLERIIDILQEKKITVILAGMKIPPNYGIEYTQEFEQIYAQLAKQYQIPLIPFLLEGVAGISHLNQYDGIHPTAEGYTIVFETVWKTLVTKLKKQHAPKE